ncbi:MULTISPECIES: protein-glutamate methylesterase/protein-glutamine glutaminase [Bacillus amyloliquefaciens group]|uniref:protein-glutamate methylesterase/protein-glutamine glutaminase n=1 Tax=Bacillus amyloliquefaciens group TaxID=1938374 RepID=UPI00057BFA1E|nr:MULTISPECIES: chemotaxis response regulator protein-glutamate methylesterase [Bacillus amyloliquefaciens group]MEB3984908.1 chemotaxis response regulator protein-glutamate methylesterase [Bacillus velezensis]POR15060.1 chemotaxis response regulator protein-glutamate methylesterase [Bacillus velezensis]QCE18434.1 chemotaxis response regulator protein-glutamate methylesterase [Bacillus velezensis]UFK58625.1 chemotaxis response regulator protein-glutamate methylesterase [Bacillus amyloliquefaci
MIRVLVVDDSAFMRKMITDFLAAEVQIEVIGTARNGEEALKKIELLKPDVVTLDIEMPVMNGTDTLRKIISIYKLPVIMVSSQTQQGKDRTINCLEMGAFDFITKPSGAISLDLYKIKEQLIERVIAAGLSRAQKPEAAVKESSIPERPALAGFDRSKAKSAKQAVFIATSTGGPRALQKVIPKLPKDLKAPVFVVQHMPEGFTASLADRLNHLSDIQVKEAENGEEAKDGWVYIAPGGKNMTVAEEGGRLRIILDVHDTESRHKPSADYLFRSASRLSDYEKVAVIMTGMGSDGTEGVKEMLRTGGVKTIAESDESCVVFGMPKSAIKAGLIHEIKHVEDIAASITGCVKKERV